jgi:tRNA(Ile)-lysidine synthase
MDLLRQFQQYIHDQKLFSPNETLLLAVSGGVDSVVLCDLCKQSGFDFAIAHCNFQLRGKASDLDEEFVQTVGAKYHTEVFTKKFDTEKYAAENKCSIQVAARELRYNWFKSLIDPSSKKTFGHLLTAHHANDNIETVLINFFKGTGITGLHGILPISGSAQKIIRPLLFAKKISLEAYAMTNKLVFREDASNEEIKYTRNYFRNRILPSLKEIYPQVEDNLLANISRFTEIDIIYTQAIAALKKKLLVEQNGEYHLPVLKLLKTDALQTVLFELVKEFGFTPGQTADIIKLLHAESGKHVDSSTHCILRNRAWLIISKRGVVQQAHFIIEENDKKINFSNYVLTIERKNKLNKLETDPAIAQLDARKIKFPLLLRRWKQGDYFYPLGMQKKKKLSRFFIDRKLSAIEKQDIWVIEMDKKIVWIAGQRIDDRFKISSNTTAILKFVVSPA